MVGQGYKHRLHYIQNKSPIDKCPRNQWHPEAAAVRQPPLQWSSPKWRSWRWGNNWLESQYQISRGWDNHRLKNVRHLTLPSNDTSLLQLAFRSQDCHRSRSQLVALISTPCASVSDSSLKQSIRTGHNWVSSALNFDYSKSGGFQGILNMGDFCLQSR